MPRGAPKAHTIADVPRSGWHAWKSSNVIGGHYDPETQILWIRFNNSYYVYSEVPPRVWQGLLSAASKGKFHNTAIKWQFPYSGPIAI